MASTISAGTTSSTGLVATADTTGNLQLASNNGTVAVTIDTSQNVGVGTASPGSYGKLTVNDTAAKSIYVRSSSTNFSGLLLENTNSATKWQIGVEGGAFNTAGLLNIGIDAIGSKMAIDSSGNVGIGTSSPVAKLAVVGGTTNASNLATAYSSASFNITPKSTSGYSLQFGSGPGDLPYIQQSAGGAAAGDMTIQPYGGRLIVGTTTNTYNGHTLQYDPGASGWALAVINSKTDNSTATDGLLVKYSGVTPNDGYQMFLCQDGSNVNRFFVTNAGATGGTSDGRLKKNITTARDGYLEDLGKIRVVKYNWNEQPEGTPKELGWIAQEVEQVFPQMISTDAETGYKSVKYSVFVPLLIKAVQELTAKVTALEEQVLNLGVK